MATPPITVHVRPPSPEEEAWLAAREAAEVGDAVGRCRARVRGVAVRLVAIVAVLALMWAAVWPDREQRGRAALVSASAVLLAAAAVWLELGPAWADVRAVRARWRRPRGPVRELALTNRRAVRLGDRLWLVDIGDGWAAALHPWWDEAFVPRQDVRWVAFSADTVQVHSSGPEIPIHVDVLPDDVWSEEHPLARDTGPAVFVSGSEHADLCAAAVRFENGRFPLAAP